MAGSIKDSDQPLRYACDRCHTQKLRCPRSVDPDGTSSDEPCPRCVKAGVACVVSLRGKVGRPSKAGKKKPSRSSRSYLTPEMEFPTDSSGGALDLCDVDIAQSWGQDAEARLADMLDLNKHTQSNQSPGLPPSHHPSALENFPDNLTLEMTPFDSFLMDFDSEIDLPTFYIPTDIPSMLDSADNLDTATAVMSDIVPDDGASNTTPASTSQTSANSAPSLSVTAMRKSRRGSNLSDMLDKHSEKMLSASASTPEFSSTACYQKLSDLNSRILSSPARSNPASNCAQLLKEVVSFSGQLIDTARRSVPHIAGSTSAPNTPAMANLNRTESYYASRDNGDAFIDSAYSLGPFGKESSWATPGSQSGEPCVPESAVIFLLLGCYTQILHLFEVTTNCIWAQHCDDKDTPAPTASDNGGTVGSLLEASLAIHTVTYLLGRLHRAFAAPEPGRLQQSDETTGDAVDMQGWKRSFVGGKGLDEGLLGRAFGEIREREQWLMRRTQFLQQRINKCHM